MSSTRPPKLALWILTRFGCSPNNDAVMGDLVEQYYERQSPTWFWKQVFVAIASALYEEALANKLRILGAILAGFAVNVALEQLVFHVASGFLPLSASLYWWFIYRPALTATVCGGVSGWIAAVVGQRHRRATVLCYALTTIVVVAVQFTAFVFYVRRPYLTEQQRALSMIPIILEFLYVPAILVGGFWGTNRQGTDDKQRV